MTKAILFCSAAIVASSAANAHVALSSGDSKVQAATTGAAEPGATSAGTSEAAASVSGQVPASGATASQDAQNKDIVVTALRSRTTVQKAPAAVTVLPGDVLVKQQITDLRAAQVLSPSGRFNADRNATQIFIRGIGSQLDFYWIPEAVAVNFNGAYVPRFTTGGAFYDLESVQILPGPQGVLYGRSAGGGVIAINARRPARQTQAYGNLEYGNYDTIRLTGAVNLPVTDTLAVRAAVNVQKHHGYQSLGNDSQNAFATRLSALYDGGSGFSLYVWGNYFKDSGKPIVASYLPDVSGIDPYYIPPTDPVTGNSNSTGFMHFHYLNGGGEAKYSFSGVTADYVATALQQSERSVRNLTGSNQIYRAGQHQYTQDLKFNSEGSGPFQWIAGASWFLANSNFESRFGPRQFGQLFPSIKQRSYSAFAQVTYSAASTVRLVGGARASHDKLVIAGSAIACFATCSYPPINFNRSWTHVDLKGGLEVDLAPRIMAYANVQTGYAPGTLNTFPDSSTFNKEVQPQTLLAYTAGLKSQFADGLLTFNVEGFYYDYKKLIVQQFNATTAAQALFNVPKTTIYGAQVTTILRLDSADTFTFNAAYTHGRYGSFQSAPTSRNLDKLQTSLTPSVTGNVAYDHLFHLADGAHVDFRVSTYFSSSYWGTFDHAPFTQQGGFTKTDGSLTYRAPDDRFSLGAWIKNAENKAVYSSLAATTFAAPYRAATFIEPPRTYGLSLGFKL